MFKKPMTVTISDIKIRTGGPSALASFTQTFAQGNYKDAGPKQLVMVREAGALKIASERMLRSQIESAPVPADERFRFVVSGGLLLSQEPDEAWATGPVTFDSAAREPAVASRRVDIAKLPPELARWQGRRVRLVSVANVICEARIKGFRMLARSVPHFSTSQAWNEMPAPEVARQAWDMGAKVLVADADQRCDGAFWGQPLGGPAPATAPSEEPDPPLKARALAQLRASDAWKKIQKSYLESPAEGVKRWDQVDGTRIQVWRFRALRAGTPIRLVSVSVTLYQSCAEFGANLWGLYEERGGKLVPRNTPGQIEAFPVAAVDSDGDGNSELLTEPFPSSFGHEGGRVLLDGELWDTSEELTVPFFDCPC